MKSSIRLPNKLTYDSRMIKDELNHYYIIIQIPLIDAKSENQTDSIISIDPGSRTFITCYDPKGNIIEGGKNDIEKISRLLHNKNKLLKDIMKSKKKYKKKRALKRLCKRIRNMIDDCHKKLCKFLCSTYSIILIPKLNFHDLKLNKRKKNKLKEWRHCEFVDRLITKSREYFCNVIVVKEDYTSKTCTNCGNIKYDLGSSKSYCCEKCKILIDRDINGSRNILLKYLTEKSL
jgi:putative transposase